MSNINRHYVVRQNISIFSAISSLMSQNNKAQGIVGKLNINRQQINVKSIGINHRTNAHAIYVYMECALTDMLCHNVSDDNITLNHSSNKYIKTISFTNSFDVILCYDMCIANGTIKVHCTMYFFWYIYCSALMVNCYPESQYE